MLISISTCCFIIFYYYFISRFFSIFLSFCFFFFFFQAEDGIRDYKVTGVQTCALPICVAGTSRRQNVLELGANEIVPGVLSAATPANRPPSLRMTACETCSRRNRMH